MASRIRALRDRQQARGLIPPVVRASSSAVASMPPLLASRLLLVVAYRAGWLPASVPAPEAPDPSWAAWLAALAVQLSVALFALALPMAAAVERLQA